MKRAYSTIRFKSFETKSDGRTYFEGIASTPTPDRMGDIVEPKGAQFKLPMPFLYQHNSRAPIGQITTAKASADNITVKGYIENVSEPQALKDRLDLARAEMKSGLVRGLSIGFVPMDSEPMNPKEPYGAQRFKTWDWLELSAVTIPANADASLTAIKSIDERVRAALGNDTINSDDPGGSGVIQQKATTKKPTAPVKGKATMKKSIAEQIAAFEAKRAASAARMEEIMDVAAEEGSTLDETQKAEYETLKAEVKEVDEHITRLKAHQSSVAASATPVKGDTQDAGTASRQGRISSFSANSNLPKGIGLARYVKALAYAKGNNAEAQNYAKQWDDSTPEVGLALKAAVSAGTTADSAWAGPLVYNVNLASEFLTFLRPQTIIGKITGFRRVPFNIRYATQTSGSTVGWVGEATAKPVSKLVLSSASLGFAKAAGIVVITQELARFSSPAAELLVRDDLAAQMVEFLDQQFIDPSVAAVAATNPASVTNGASNTRQAAAVWTSTSNIETDVKAFLQTFADNEIYLDNTAYWVMTPSAALALSMIRTTNGPFAYPDITISGGTFFGIPVIVSNSVPHSVSAGSIVVLLKASEIILADDDQIAIDVSQEASLQMDSAPTQTSATPTASTVVSMFQTNSLAVRCERVINWARRRTYAVGYIDNMHTA